MQLQWIYSANGALSCCSHGFLRAPLGRTLRVLQQDHSETKLIIASCGV